MVCVGFERGTVGWKAYTNPLSYGSTPIPQFVYLASTRLAKWLEEGTRDQKVISLHPCTGYYIIFRMFVICIGRKYLK